MFRNGPRFPVIEPTCGWSAAPVVSDELILLAGGATGHEAGDAPILQAIDGAGERFRLSREVTGRQIEPGAVTTTPGGDIVVPVYEHDTSLQVLRVGRDGVVRTVDELPDDDPYDIVACDTRSKLRVAVAALDDDAYLCSWLYRQGSRQGITYRRWGEERYRWRSEEWLLHASGDIVLGVTSPDYERPGPAQQWVGRDAATGAIRWFIDACGYVLAGQVAGALVAVDLAAFDRADRDERSGAASSARETGIFGIDLLTGGRRWSTSVPGRVHSATVGPDGVSVYAERPEDGTCRVHHLGPEGAHEGITPLGGHACVVARTADFTLALVEGQWLMALDNPGQAGTAPAEPPWTIPLPPGGLAPGHAARIADMRLDTVPITLAGSRCHLRGTGSLQIIDV